MKISFRKSPLYFSLSLVIFGLNFITSIVCAFVEPSANSFSIGTAGLVMAVLLLIAYFGKFSKSKTPDILNFIGYLFLILFLVSVIGSISTIANVAYGQTGSNSTNLVMQILLWTFSALSWLTLIVSIISLALVSSKKNQTDMLHLANICNILLIVFLSLSCLFSFFAVFTYQLTLKGDITFISYILEALVGAVLFFYMGRGIILKSSLEAMDAPLATGTVKAENGTAVSVNDEAKKADILATYKKLLDGGAITQEEFEKKKKDLL